MSLRKLAPVGAVALALTWGSAEAAPAQTVTSMAQSALRAEASSAATEVGWRHRRWRRGGGALLGLGAGIVIGSIIASEAHRHRRGYDHDDYAYDGPYHGGDPRVACAESFRSFEWRTGLYTTYSGEKRLCPYLR
jgi:hypothetical protein